MPKMSDFSLKKFLHFHFHKFHHTAGANAYYECRCGDRIWKPVFKSVYSPVDVGWLNGGEYTPRRFDPVFSDELRWTPDKNFYNDHGATPVTDSDNFARPSPLRPELASFALRMEHVLQENDSKEHWTCLSQDLLRYEMKRQFDKLADAVAGNDHGQTIKRAVHAANYAMMLADNAIKKMERKHSEDTAHG